MGVFLVEAKHTVKVSFAIAQDCLQAHPAALSDPVAQPPVAEGNAACGGEEEEDVDDED